MSYTEKHMMTELSEPITVIGTGLMGSAIARALAKGGYRVTAWNRTLSRAQLLAGAGVAVCPELSQAIEFSPNLFLIQSDYAIASQTLDGMRDRLAGKTLINGITGTGAQARELAAFASSCGATYLDAGIQCYPSDIGRPEGLINYSGDQASWHRCKPALMLLGGASGYLGADPGLANLVDAATAGAFFNVSLGAFHEAAAFARTAGLTPNQLLPTVLHMMRLLERILTEEAAPSIERGNYASDQVTLDVYVSAVRAWRDEMLIAGQRASLMTANLHNLELAQAAGFGHQSIYAQYLTAGVARHPTKE